MKPTGILLGIVLLLAAGGCSNSDDRALSENEDRIHRVRNTEFTGEHLRVFLTLPDGTERSVNSADDAVGPPRPPSPATGRGTGPSSSKPTPGRPSPMPW